ncbi:MAG: UvrB/UvrC motif-containing protein [Bacillota bacterium]
MLCQECRQNEANIHIVKNVNGKQTELNLCESCARKKDELDFSSEPQFSLHKLFSSMLNQGLYGNGKREEKLAGDKKCPSCSLTFAQFGQVGHLGCSDCVSAFDDKLKPLLKRIHGSTVHTGKVPAKARKRVNILRELDQLKEELQLKVQNEEFERAAELRDRIREIEKDINQENTANNQTDLREEGEEH